MTTRWRMEERGGIVVIRCAAFDPIAPLAHGFTTRRADGRGAFDAGGADAGDAGASAARHRAAEAVGLANAPVVLRQVHGTRLVAATAGGAPEEADGAYWDGGAASACPAVRSADCVPLLLAHREGKAAAAVHAGWRGVAGGIVGEAVRVLKGLGFPPESWIAAIGPAIGPCCYAVGEDVAGAVLRAVGGGREGQILSRPDPDGQAHLDLAAAVANQLRAAGVTGERIEVAPWCTRCDADLFHSYRRDGERSGRMLAMVGPCRRP